MRWAVLSRNYDLKINFEHRKKVTSFEEANPVLLESSWSSIPHLFSNNIEGRFAHIVCGVHTGVSGCDDRHYMHSISSFLFGVPNFVTETSVQDLAKYDRSWPLPGIIPQKKS
tara:strand:+ start:1192 stop:1530 length:339 start_codon:yes stop_codon:yes gene_type:complete